jgi:hypothetical protein
MVQPVALFAEAGSFSRYQNKNPHRSRQKLEGHGQGALVSKIRKRLGLPVYPLRISQKPPYSNTKIFFPAHISLRIFGHTVTLTSPR